MSDFQNMVNDAVTGIRDSIEIEIPDDPADLDRFPPAAVLTYRNATWLVLAFAVPDGTLTLEAIGYRDGREVLRRVLDL